MGPLDVYEPFQGSGKLYLREYGVAGALAEIGNCSDLKFTTELDEQDLQDYTSPAGGTYASSSRVKSCSVSFSAYDFNTDNLARAMGGEASNVAAPSIALQTFTAYQGGLIELAGLNPGGVTVEDTGGAGTTYVEGTDYEVRPHGIYILSGSIVDGTDVDITPTTLDGYDLVEALLSSGKNYELLFGGFNGAMDDKAMVVKAFKVKLNPADVSLISDGFDSIPFTGKVQKDTSVTGTGKSQYYTTKKAA